MRFIVGFVGTLGFVIFLSVAWPAIILGISGIFVIDTLKAPAPQRTADVEGFDRSAKELVKIMAIRQSGQTMIAEISNSSLARIYNLILYCDGGPSMRDHSGWVNAGTTSRRVFNLRDFGPHSGCILGYEVDYDEATRKQGHNSSARPYFDDLAANASSSGDGSIVTVRGTITNYVAEHINLARLKCFFTSGDIDVEYMADIDVSINAKATGSVASSFRMPYTTQNGILCKAMNVVTGDSFK